MPYAVPKPRDILRLGLSLQEDGDEEKSQSTEAMMKQSDKELLQDRGSLLCNQG